LPSQLLPKFSPSHDERNLKATGARLTTWESRLAWTLLLTLLVYNAATLGRVPAFINDDDGAYASAGYRFWQTGQPGMPGLRLLGLDRDVWPFGRTAAAFEGVFLHFASVSVRAAVLPSFLAGVGLLSLTAALGRRLWDSRTALLAALLLAASGKFYDACRWARPDMLLAVFFVAGLCLAASAPPGQPYRRLFLAGLLMGLSGDVHLNGFLLAPLPLLCWLLLRAEAWRVRWRGTLSFVAAGGGGVLFWLALHYWPHPELFRMQASIYGGKTHGLRIAQLGLAGALRSEVQRYLDWFWEARGHRHALEGMGILTGAAWALLRQGRPGRALVGVWVGFFLIATAFMSNTFGWYLILVWPLFALWMARAFLTVPWRHAAGLALGMLLAAYLVNLTLWYVKARGEVPFQARVEEVRRVVPAQVPVLGNGAFWFAFWDRDYTDYQYLQLRDLQDHPPVGWGEEQQKFGWRYVAAVGDLRRFLDPAVAREELLATPVYRGRQAQILKARAFSLDHCAIDRRFTGSADSILLLRVLDDSPKP
jgi:hypothetical protein